MARSFLPPVDTVLPSNRLKLLYAPIQRVVTHGGEQLAGCIHDSDSITSNIICQGE